MPQRIPGPVPEPGLPADPAARPGEWITVDGVAYRCVVLCFLFRPGDRPDGARPGSAPASAPDSRPDFKPDARPGSAPGSTAGFTVGADTRDVLLGLKRTGFGAGRVVALGGKIDGRESALDAAVREVAEESGIELEPSDVRDAGRITWSFPARPAWNMAAFLFTADAGTSTPVASEEIEPRWYAVDALPWHSMWQDAPHWIPLLLDGRRVAASIVMAMDNEAVASAVVH